MTTVEVIIISLIANTKIAIIIPITKNHYHNNSNNNNNNNKVPITVIIFKIITTTSIIMIIIIIIIIITDHYLQLTKSSYRYCFPCCPFFEKKCFLTQCLYVLTLSVVLKKSDNLFQILWATYKRLLCPWLVFLNGWLVLNKKVLVAVVFWPASLNTSFIYKGLK